MIVGWILLMFPVVVVVYAYGLYPVVLRVVAGRARSAARGSPASLPLVSIVVPAYNEQRQIRGAIEALIAQNYPPDRREIFIVSDASTDQTDDIVREYANRGVQLIRIPTRGGKTAAENASCGLLRGDIVVNSDASVRLHPAAVSELVDAMVDPHVGVASTRDVSVGPDADVANVAEAGYVGYEMRLRALETRAGGIVGASGSGYAIRAHLHRIPIRHDLSRDFAAALTARVHGLAAVSVDDAICYVPRTGSLESEYRRKVRTIARGAETLAKFNALLDPTQYGAFAWKLLSHKVCRWLVPVSAVIGAVGLALLAREHRWALALLILGAFGALSVAVGASWPLHRKMPRLLSALTFGVAANVAVLHALLRVAFGHHDHLWEPTRRDPVLTRRVASTV